MLPSLLLPPRGQLAVHTCDVDEAFEACSSAEVLPAFTVAARQYLKHTGAHTILIRRGKADIFQKQVRAHGLVTGGPSHLLMSIRP